MPADSMKFRVRYEIAGAHVHCLLYFGREGAFALLGELTMREDEFYSMQQTVRVDAWEFLPKESS